MAGMTRQEMAKLINRYIGVSGGYLADFSYRTHRDFYPEYCDLSFDTYAMPGTTRERFETILAGENPWNQAKIVRGVLAKYPPNPELLATRTEELHDELLTAATRLEGCSVGSLNPVITSDVVERAIADAEMLINSQGATSGVDRLHTALHGYLKAVCDESGIEYTRDITMNGLFKMVREKHAAFADLGPRSQDITTVMRALASIMDAMNPIRNRPVLPRQVREPGHCVGLAKRLGPARAKGTPGWCAAANKSIAKRFTGQPDSAARL